MTPSTFIRSIALTACAFSFTQSVASNLEADFQDPGNEARPRAFWNWLNGDVTHEGLTRDLEEAKAKGLGGLEIWDSEAMQNENGFVPAGPTFLGPESVASIHHTLKEAERLDLVVGMVACSGWNAGGPWVPPEHASKNLFYTETMIIGPGLIEQELPFPEVPEMCPVDEDGMPLWYKEVAVLALPERDGKLVLDQEEIIDLTEYMEDGVLRWVAPPGNRIVLRFVCTNNGQQLIAASPNSKGPFIDFLDPAATRFHFEYIMERIGLEKGGDPSPFEYLEVDSMELNEGIQWSTHFGEWFEIQHGYDATPWLPVLAGWTVENGDSSERFLYDYKKSVSDRLISSHYKTAKEVCHEYGLELVAEAGGPGPPIWDTCPVDSLKALGQLDVPRGEFWVGNRHDIFLIKEIASAAHIYGKRFVDAESWTTWRRWKDSPFARKRWLDRAFCEGLNRVTYHVFAHSPEGGGFPGRNYHAGIDMNPQTTWWSKARPFMDYIARCSRMLQEGLFVADVAYYYGDQAPNFWPMHHNVPEKILLPGLGKGYDYDVVNTDVILNRMSVKDGRIVLPNGMSYRMLVLPDQKDKWREQKEMPLEVLEKIKELVADGATVIGAKPYTVPGLYEHEARSEKLRAIADELWGGRDQVSAQVLSYGKGKIVTGMSPREWLKSQSVGPDFESLDGGFLDYIHRSSDEREIYFVRNRAEDAFAGRVAFRVSGRQAELWDPETGTVRAALADVSNDASTEVLLNLDPGGSLFVVFPEKSARDSIDLVDAEDLRALETVSLEGDQPAVRIWKNGKYRFKDGDGNEQRIKVQGLPDAQVLEGPWQVAFDPEWGAPAKLEFPELISWTDHSIEGIRNYSGAGNYTQQIEVDSKWLKSGRRLFVDLGDVREIAEVFVNGESAGILWNPPFRADVTELVKAGKNELRIEVMNLWINRLVADGELPEEERFTRTNIRWARQDWEAQPAGLLGPVQMIAAEELVFD